MTLIITQISKHGILHASDSNLSDSGGSTVGEGTKCFVIPKLKAGLTVAGAYGVGNLSMDRWMPEFIKKSNAVDLEQFSEELRTALEQEMDFEQKESGSLIHVAGYVKKQEKYHPEFWFVRNVYHLDLSTGEYSDIRKEFTKSEDFWTRDNKSSDLFRKCQSDDSMYQLYINGFSPGRIGYNIVQAHLMEFFSKIWSHPDWEFRPPKNIDEAALLVVDYMRIINTIFKISDYSGQVIGGTIKYHKIPQPSSIETKVVTGE